MVSRATTRISRERAQDWISSVLNPIVEGLRREARGLLRGPWHWQHATAQFEYLYPIREYVAEIYLDNFEDFLEKHPEMRARFQQHDDELERLRKSVADAFQTLTTGQAGQGFRTLFEQEVGSRVPQDKRPYPFSYLASGVRELPPGYAGHESFNALSPRVREAAATAMADAGREAAAQMLAQTSAGLLHELLGLRTELADRYGARIMPVIG